MSNYDLDEIERKKSQKQKKQWREYVDKSLEHPLDSSEATRMPMAAPVVLEDEGKNAIKDHIDKENKDMTNDPIGYAQRHDPKSTLPLGNKDEVDDQENIRKIRLQNWKRNPLKNIHHALEERDLPLVDDNTSREELDLVKKHIQEKKDQKSNEESITKPKYYEGFEISPLEYIVANELDFMEGNIVKYVSRYLYKGGVNDLLKARTYLEKLIDRERMKNE